MTVTPFVYHLRYDLQYENLMKQLETNLRDQQYAEQHTDGAHEQRVGRRLARLTAHRVADGALAHGLAALGRDALDSSITDVIADWVAAGAMLD